MPFSLSHRSLVNLQGVHPDLQRLVLRTLQISPLDFAIIDGLRTEEEEAECVASGKSETTHSRHLTGEAVDFMAYVNGQACWLDDVPQGAAAHLHPYHQIAEAFRQAAVELGIAIEWGGCWDRRLDQQESAAAAYSGYLARRKALGKSAFPDLDHIQLDPTIYP